MDPVTGGLIGAGVGAAGDLLGGAMTGAANAKEAEKNRHWQAMMAGSAHQRQVADMRAAGLNPILSGMGGSGAATGSGAQASMPDMSSIGSRTVQAYQKGPETATAVANARVAKQQSDIQTSAVGKEAMAYGIYKSQGMSDKDAKAMALLHAVERHKSPIMAGLDKAWKFLKPKASSAVSSYKTEKERKAVYESYKHYKSGMKPKKKVYRVPKKMKNFAPKPKRKDGANPMPWNQQRSKIHYIDIGR